MSAGQLARKMGRTPWGVRKAIKRLKLKPEQTLGGVNYYSASPTLARLEAAMRKANSPAN